MPEWQRPSISLRGCGLFLHESKLRFSSGVEVWRDLQPELRDEVYLQADMYLRKDAVEIRIWVLDLDKLKYQGHFLSRDYSKEMKSIRACSRS